MAVLTPVDEVRAAIKEALELEGSPASASAVFEAVLRGGIVADANLIRRTLLLMLDRGELRMGHDARLSLREVAK